MSSELSFIETARREQLIRAATRVIAEVGYRKASLAAISSAAGVSVGVIAYHFGNRAGLFRAVVADAVERATAAISPRVTGAGSASAGLRALVEANIEFLLSHPDDLRALTEIIQNGRDDGLLDDDRAETSVADVQRVLDWGHTTGEFRPFDSRVMALTVRAGIDAVVVQPPGALDPLSAARELADLFDAATRSATR